MKRTLQERRAYAMRQLDIAIKRGDWTEDDAERDRAQSRARAWHSGAYAPLNLIVRIKSISNTGPKR